MAFACAFVLPSASAVAPLRSVWVGRSSRRAPAPTLRTTTCRRVRMSTPDSQPPDAKKTPMEQEQSEPAYSVWGVASFAIIFAIFMIGILATLARDFVPGGMVGPA